MKVRLGSGWGPVRVRLGLWLEADPRPLGDPMEANPLIFGHFLVPERKPLIFGHFFRLAGRF